MKHPSKSAANENANAKMTHTQQNMPSTETRSLQTVKTQLGSTVGPKQSIQ